MRFSAQVVVGLVLGASASLACAQVITSRESNLNYNYVYGAGGDTHTGGDSRQKLAVLPSDTDSMGFLGSTSGELPGGLYSAAASCQIEYQYTISGPLHEIHSISGSASSDLAASTTGIGSAAMFSANPGNETYLYFTVDTAIGYRLSGSRVRPGSATVRLQRFDGLVWQYVFYSEFLPVLQTSFDVSGTLVPGSYRIRGGISFSANANQNVIASYDYLLEVPEYGSCDADFNHDNVVDFFDYLDFVDAFSANLPSADFNNDLTIDFFDYLDFVDAFSIGC